MQIIFFFFLRSRTHPSTGVAVETQQPRLYVYSSIIHCRPRHPVFFPVQGKQRRKTFSRYERERFVYFSRIKFISATRWEHSRELVFVQIR